MRVALALALAAAGCVDGDEPVAGSTQAIEAHCTAEVDGIGRLDVETDYLPHVVNCENGGAAFEALRAQAIAARSYLYYKLDTSGRISDGTGDQVYGCPREPRDEHREAVRSTAGMVLRYMDTQIAAFYVAGALQSAPECRGGAEDPTGTERYVTYNEGRAGDELEQTTLGWVDPGNHANRGCMSQNGSDCLASTGASAEDIVRFYYGADIEIVVAEGPCVEEAPAPDAGPSDAGQTPEVDAGRRDAGGLVFGDVGPPLGVDAGPRAGGRPPTDGLHGGCAAAARPGSDGDGAALALLLLALGTARRRTS